MHIGAWKERPPNIITNHPYFFLWFFLYFIAIFHAESIAFHIWKCALELETVPYSIIMMTTISIFSLAFLHALYWLSQKRNKVHMKSPSPFYLINFGYLHWIGGLMDSIFIGLGRFSQVTTIFLFDSWCMYPFCGTLTSVFTAFLCVFASYWCFILAYALLTWHQAFWMIINH